MSNNSSSAQVVNKADDIINTFKQITANPYQSIGQWKALNKRPVIGCMPMQIPEELIHAFGALPIIVPESQERITIASKHIQHFFCGFARSIIDAALRDRLDFLDGMVFQDTCHTMRPIFDIISKNRPKNFMKRIFMPVALHKTQAKPFLMGELERFRSSLEAFFNIEMDNERLQKSIHIYNQNRELMKAVYELRQDRPDILTANELVMVVKASMVMPKEDHNILLENFISSLPSREPTIAVTDSRPRLLLTGSLCESPPEGLLTLIEEVGGMVVDDDLYSGSRYFLTQVPTRPNPIEALADAYLNMIPPCPTRIYPQLRLGDYLVEKAKQAKAEGIIVFIVKYCEAHDYTYPHMRRRFESAGIPHLKIETEHETLSLEQAKTRLQAFMEIIQANKDEETRKAI